MLLSTVVKTFCLLISQMRCRGGCDFKLLQYQDPWTNFNHFKENCVLYHIALRQSLNFCSHQRGLRAEEADVLLQAVLLAAINRRPEKVISNQSLMLLDQVFHCLLRMCPLLWQCRAWWYWRGCYASWHSQTKLPSIAWRLPGEVLWDPWGSWPSSAQLLVWSCVLCTRCREVSSSTWSRMLGFFSCCPPAESMSHICRAGWRQPATWRAGIWFGSWCCFSTCCSAWPSLLWLWQSGCGFRLCMCHLLTGWLWSIQSWPLLPLFMVMLTLISFVLFTMTLDFSVLTSMPYTLALAVSLFMRS